MALREHFSPSPFNCRPRETGKVRGAGTGEAMISKMRRRSAQRHAGQRSSAGQGSRAETSHKMGPPIAPLIGRADRKVPVPSVSPSHAMAVVEVAVVSLRNNFDLVLKVEADPLQRE